jgi:hypothetical protein
MLKVIAASMVFVLVVGTGAFGGIIQDLHTGIEVQNAIDLLHGSQWAGSSQNLVVDNEQCATGICSAIAQESLFGAIGQVGTTTGECGLVGLAQDLQIAGTQGQEVGDGIQPKAQVQGLALLATQTLAKSDGQGAADALHTIVLNAGQTAQNPAGTLSESSTVMGMQQSYLNGAPGATAIVDTGMSVTTTQTQAAL